MIVALHAVVPKGQASLQVSVPVSKAADGAYCLKSLESINDTMVNRNGQTEDVVGISKIMLGTQVVGFIYRGKSGGFYLQALRGMPYPDQEKAHAIVSRPGSRSNATSSSEVQISGLPPWTDLRVEPCRKADFSSKP